MEQIGTRRANEIRKSMEMASDF